MIVRINQIELARAEAEAGWPPGVHLGPFKANWPAGVRAFEMLILSEDEKKQPLSEEFRQQQFRQMIPQTAIALAGTGEVPVLRLDGPLSDNELLPAWRYLTDPNGRGRYAFSATSKLDDVPADVSSSVRIVTSWKRLSAICNDPVIGLERSVRARLIFADEAFTAGLLDVSEADDPRWEQLLAECPLMIGTTARLRSLQIVTRQLDLPQVKAKVMNRLMAVARGEPAVP